MNPRPVDYESTALPLCYISMINIISFLNGYVKYYFNKNKGGTKKMENKLVELFKKAKYVSVPSAKSEPENLQDYIMCIKCEKKIPENKHKSEQKVCPFCGFYTRLKACERLGYIADPDSFE